MKVYKLSNKIVPDAPQGHDVHYITLKYSLSNFLFEHYYY